MQKYIKGYLHKYAFKYEPIPSVYIPNIYNLFHDDVYNEVENGIVLLHYGIFHQINKRYYLIKEYYLRAIAYGNDRAMNLLALHYKNNGDYDNAVKYWSNAVACGNSLAMNNLASCYADFETAIKYYFMAIDHKDYRQLECVISYCKMNNSVTHLITLFNKILNNEFNKCIIGTLTQLICNWNSLSKTDEYDMLNILINVDKTKWYDIFHLLP